MLAEDYDHLISDPTDYMLRTYLPRTVGAFAGFANMSSLFDFVELPFVSGQVGGWGSPEMVAGLEKIATAARAVGGWAEATFAKHRRTHGPGLPPLRGGRPRPRSTSWATPFGAPAASSSTCTADRRRCWRPARGWYRWPSTGRSAARWTGDPGDLHASPQGRRRLHERRAVPHVLLAQPAEGICLASSKRATSRSCSPRADTARGWKPSWTCPRPRRSGCSIRPTWLVPRRPSAGGLHPRQRALSLLYAGTPEETAAYCRGLIDTAGQGGGFILNIGAVADGGKEENLRAMIKTAQGIRPVLT